MRITQQQFLNPKIIVGEDVNDHYKKMCTLGSLLGFTQTSYPHIREITHITEKVTNKYNNYKSTAFGAKIKSLVKMPKKSTFQITSS